MHSLSLSLSLSLSHTHTHTHTHARTHSQVTCLTFLHPGTAGLRGGTMFADDEILVAGTSEGTLVYIADAEHHATRDASYVSMTSKKSTRVNNNR